MGFFSHWLFHDILNRRVVPNLFSRMETRDLLSESPFGNWYQAFIRMLGWLDLGRWHRFSFLWRLPLWIDLPLHQARSVYAVWCSLISVDKGLWIHDHPLDHPARNRPISMLKLRMKHWVFPFSERPWENGCSLLGTTDFSRKTYHSLLTLSLGLKIDVELSGFWFLSFGWIPKTNPERGRVTRGKRFACSLKAFACEKMHMSYIYIYICV